MTELEKLKAARDAARDAYYATYDAARAALDAAHAAYYAALTAQEQEPTDD